MNFMIETDVVCPYCGEEFPVAVDTSEGEWSTIEDCTVCCRPIALLFECAPGEVLTVDASRA